MRGESAWQRRRRASYCTADACAQLSRVAPLALGSTSDQDELAVVGERTFAQRDAECRKRAIDLDTERPRNQAGQGSSGWHGGAHRRHAVRLYRGGDARVRELTQPAIEQWMA